MIKRLLTITFVSLCLLLGVSSCTDKTSDSNTNTNQKSEIVTTDGKKLVVFFSHTGKTTTWAILKKVTLISSPI